MITKVRSQAWSPYSDRGRARLRSVLAHDDPTDQIGAANGIRFNADGTVTAVSEPLRHGGGSAIAQKQ